MCGSECSGCWRGYCRVVRGAPRALGRSVIEEYLIGWIVFISRVFLFNTLINCFLLLLLHFAFRSFNGESTQGSSRAVERTVPWPT